MSDRRAESLRQIEEDAEAYCSQREAAISEFESNLAKERAILDEAERTCGEEVVVAFVGEQDSGFFALLYEEYCKGGSTAVARALIRDVMEWLPPSKVAQAFPESD